MILFSFTLNQKKNMIQLSEESVKKIHATIALLNSMVNSGENHSEISKLEVDEAFRLLAKK